MMTLKDFTTLPYNLVMEEISLTGSWLLIMHHILRGWPSYHMTRLYILSKERYKGHKSCS